MPPYEAAILSDQDAADLYAYLRQMPAPRDPKTIPLLNAAH
jgi:cytochrome c